MKAVTLEEARHRWNGALAPRIPSIEYVSPQQAYGRIVGQDIRAIHPYPPYRKSPFDGYALHLDTQCRTYEIIATIGAGMLYTSPVAPGQAVRLMTGCAVPDSCNTVIMQEQTIRTGHTLEITVPLQAGDNIVPAGEECRRGDLLLPHGTYLTSGDVSVAVGMGNTQIPVYQDIRVLLLTSGREVVLPGEVRHAGQIYNSNAFFFRQLLIEEGIHSVSFYHVTDDPARLESEIEAVRNLAAQADLIISTGGVSVGLFDTMPQIYEALGAHCLYNRIAMRPGSASYGGIIERKDDPPRAVLGLSGNPAAAFNAYHLLAVPVLRRMRGEKDSDFPVITCRMHGSINKKNPVERFVQGHVSFDKGEAFFTPNHVITSSALLGLAHTNGLAILPKGDLPCRDGQTVRVLLLKRLS
ncbi:molybdenum cofactor biosynthesis protein [Megasphaera cerevisiae DSM 20462]|jgi:molybdopterin molybdotransferase|uniref:Molybdopterin molybdenumtransferase n=1 Tax=Megasphaera cerevisiae DSM 20462 TaxID=1122219 RepID=A0A0J6WUW2_9FIRM|nr:molybdopterin molybdotransferase MoeA [Megasphaera cerevisiae]KMO86339.1 molybdenum cofactor biosynthesis protein [Megasphaera cerevisiae DSM 20462]OKY53418.1 molybdopterin molybdenumtransferase MoeA [Megasphaera cerevisiae]SJZ99780.1 molybdopterin molybdotransferase [Megasphaera cerevisiae DSM 20462]